MEVERDGLEQRGREKGTGNTEGQEEGGGEHPPSSDYQSLVLETLVFFSLLVIYCSISQRSDLRS
jgi:hypothetical protein